MNIDSEVVDMIAKVVAVNAVAVLVLAVMSYVLSAVMLNGLASLLSGCWIPRSSPVKGILTRKSRESTVTVSARLRGMTELKS